MRLGVILGCLLGILALGIVSVDYCGTALARESFTAECPTCGEKAVLRKGMGIMPLEKTMFCPDCKGKGAQHVCDRCGAEVAACPRCKKVLTAEAEVVKAVCPQCKVERTLRKGASIIHLRTEMKCPNCEKPIKGFEAHVCGECGAHMAVCPDCRKAL